MTGIERLREFVEGISPIAAVCIVTKIEYDSEHTEMVRHLLRDFLADIADQIERERDETYDIVLKENREAIAWVKKHGGIGFLDLHWGNMHRLVAEVARRLGYRSDCEDCEPDELLDALDRRLMPEGMEWPRFEDGEPVRVGDQFAEHGGCENVADSVEIGDCWFKIHGFDGAAPRYSRRASVKRPAPKVLDADGVEIRVGDTVWATNGHGPFEVTRIVHADRLRVICDDEESGHLNAYPENLTHCAPVLAADGKPLREGEAVYHTKSWMDKEPRVIERLEPLGDFTRVWFDNGNYEWSENLTHERPDSFALIEQDVELCPHDYAQKYDKPSGMSNAKFQRTDLVRRAKALAGDAK